MSVDINLHNVKEIRVEEKDSFKSNNPFKSNEEYMFYTRDIVVVQEDGRIPEDGMSSTIRRRDGR